MPKAKKKTKGSEPNSADEPTITKLDRPGRVRKPNTLYFGGDFDTNSETSKIQSISNVKVQRALKPTKDEKPTKVKKSTKPKKCTLSQKLN